MRRSLLLVCALFSVLSLSSCLHKDEKLLPEESDRVFSSGLRRVVSPTGKPWVLYYFPREDQESLKVLIERSEFFQGGGFRPFRQLQTGEYYSGRRARSSSEKTLTLTIYAGKLSDELEPTEPKAGASVLIVK